MKTNFEYFQIQKRMLQTVRVEKVNAKNGSFVQLPCFLSELVLALAKYVHFLLFYADLNEKSKSIKAIYMYGSERPHYTLSKNGTIYHAITYFFGDIRV